VRALEDLLALVARIDDRRRVIYAHAWREGSWDAVFDEVVAMEAELDALRAALGTVWARVYEIAGGRLP